SAAPLKPALPPCPGPPRPHFRARTSAAPLKRNKIKRCGTLLLFYFLARTSAAPLKPVDSTSITWTLRDFRARTSAAPLKPARIAAGQPRGNHFRARTSAAPLKRRGSQCRAQRRGEFPRSHERGPIEASLTCSLQACRCQISALARARPH